MDGEGRQLRPQRLAGGKAGVAGSEVRKMKPDKRRPLSDLDTELQTVGCRMANPNHCKNNSTEGKCAFVREDELCLLPPKSWKKIFAKLRTSSGETENDGGY